MVGVWSGSANTTEDYDHLVADMLAIDRAGAAASATVICVVEIDAENPRPTAVERRRISDTSRQACHAPRHYFALVTRSALVRGVMTAIGWLTQPPGRTNVSHANLDQALAWAESKRPGAASRLTELYQEARRQARDGARTSGTMPRPRRATGDVAAGVGDPRDARPIK
jgi:hypothetical protein